MAGRRFIVTEIQKALLDERGFNPSASPFNLEEFKSLTNIRARIHYCSERLKLIGSGSSRTVYRLDENKVLKLAKNRKGYGQNEVESDYGLQTYGVVPKIYDSDDQNASYIIMQMAFPARDQDFEAIVGYDFETVIRLFQRYECEYSRRPMNPWIKEEIPYQEFSDTWDNEWMYRFYNYLGDYQPPIADMTRIEHWGVVSDNEGKDILLIDAGLSEDVWNTYYALK